MSVEAMKLVNFVGLLDNFDYVTRKYVVDCEIHLENAMKVLATAKGLVPFTEVNPYSQCYKDTTQILDKLEIEKNPQVSNLMNFEDVEKLDEKIKGKFIPMIDEKADIAKQLEDNEKIVMQLEPIKDVEISLDELFHFENAKVRFGKMPKDGYKKLDTYLNDLATFFFPFDTDDEYVFGVYFAPQAQAEKIDNIYSSLYFERVRISDKVQGKPMDCIASIATENARLNQRLVDISNEMNGIKNSYEAELNVAYASVKYYFDAFEIRKYAAHTKEYFYITGWMPHDEAERVNTAVQKDEKVSLVIEEPEMVMGMEPPTKLKNPKIFKPFQGFIEMYGLPNYKELDPTIFFAITYSLMFGIMYGDVGHGLLLFTLGVIMAKKNFLGGILKLAGICSVVFGFMYGSLFGFEEIIPAILIKPMENGATMNTMLISTVILGTIMISGAMIYNFANGIRQKDFGRLFFGPSGVAGFVFYWAVLLFALTAFTGMEVFSLPFVLIFIVVPLILIFLQEPLSKLVAKKKDWMPKKKGEFFLEGFFELFEILLSYVTNTISFIRVGAFALNHAGMMMVVMTFVAQTTGATSVIVLILGNLLVAGLEGLLVAIQVLRLQFYELFSRYYSGTGRPFVSRKCESKAK